IVADRRAQIVKVLAQPALVAELTANNDAPTRAAVAQIIKAEVKDASSVTLYTAQLNEVLHGNLTQLGYARAAQLMSNLSDGDVGLAQSPVSRVMSFAGPIMGADGKPLAFATVDFPDSALRIALHSVPVSAGRVDLRQSNKSGDIVLAGVGQEGLSTADDVGVPVAHSLYRVASAPPEYWLPITRSFMAAVLLAIVTFLVGMGVLWVRPRVRARLGGAPLADEPALADVIAAAPPRSKPAPA